MNVPLSMLSNVGASIARPSTWRGYTLSGKAARMASGQRASHARPYKAAS